MADRKKELVKAGRSGSTIAQIGAEKRGDTKAAEAVKNLPINKQYTDMQKKEAADSARKQKEEELQRQKAIAKATNTPIEKVQEIEETPPSTPTIDNKEEKKEVIADAQNAATNEDGSFDVDMFLDALFTGLQNVGGTLLNVGAAYTGGSPGFKTDRKPLWRERLEGKNKAITSSLMNAVKGSDSNMQYQQLEQALKSMGYQNASEQRRQEIANQVMKEYGRAIKNGSVTDVEVENLINILNTTDTQGQLSPITNALMSLF